MNREIIRTVNVNSVTSTRGAVAGTFDFATAVADTDGNIWLGADKEIDLEVKATNSKKHFTYIDTAADA